MLRARFGAVFVLSAIYLALSLVLRLVLWVSFGIPDGLPVSEVLPCLGLGIVSDLVALVYFTFPFMLYLALVPQKLFQGRGHKFLVGLFSFLFIFGGLYLFAVEYFFFEEFDSRFNLVAVDYLIYPHEVFVNLWESYPIFWYVSATLLLSGMVFGLAWPVIRRRYGELVSFRARLGLLSVQLALVLALAFGLSSDRIEFSPNRTAVEIASNGIDSFFRALKTQELDYHHYYNTLDQDLAYQLLRRDLAQGGGSFVSDDLQDLNREFPANPRGLGKMNVVVLCQESLGSEFVEAFGGRPGLTPHLDNIAGQSLIFTDLYATGSRTVRGLEAIIAAFPPIPSVSILRRPGNENIATWGEVMQGLGYDTSFLYGGFGVFDNMNNFFRANGFSISDRTEIEHPSFGNIWGVADGDLYRHAIGYYDDLAGKGKPFFSLVMSTSNHKPFTFPEGIPGIPASGGDRDAGVKYSDYAIARFLEDSKSHAWFANTIFVIIADHDARVYGRQKIPFGRFRIPLIIYAPGKIQPQVVERAMSQIDLAPTVLGLLGLEYTAPFYGQDMLNGKDLERPVLVSHNHDVALMHGDKVVVLGLGKSAKTYRRDEKSDELTAQPNDQEMINLAIAYYQTAFEEFQGKKYKLPGQ
jgi:phosphoglycerol transferase MdoB-like AlkP superfamily enzyme